MTLSLQAIKRASSPLVWLITGMLVLAPLGPHAVAGMVLCIEESGQAVLESAVGVKCGPTVHHTQPQTDPTESTPVLAASPVAGAAHCASCVDVVLPSGGDDDCGALTPTDATSSFHLQSPLVALVLPFDVPAEEPNHALLPTEPVQRSHDLAPLRSVVLLI